MFLHHWGKGKAVDLAKAVKHAVDTQHQEKRPGRLMRSSSSRKNVRCAAALAAAVAALIAWFIFDARWRGLFR